MGVRPRIPQGSDEPTRVFHEDPPPQRELWPWLVVALVLALAGAASAWLVTRADGSNATPTTIPVAPPPPPTALPARTTTLKATSSEKPKPSTLPTIPRVVGLDEEAAKRALHDAGFQAKVEHQGKPGKGHERVVLSEQPAGGTHAPAKTKVTIYVGGGHGR